MTPVAFCTLGIAQYPYREIDGGTRSSPGRPAFGFSPGGGSGPLDHYSGSSEAAGGRACYHLAQARRRPALHEAAPHTEERAHGWKAAGRHGWALGKLLQATLPNGCHIAGASVRRIVVKSLSC